jgi:hypothetical protein
MRSFALGRIGGMEDPLEARSGFAPTMMSYLHTVFLVSNPIGVSGLRNVREMETIARTVDYIAAGRILEAMDILVQRQKSLEIAITQQSWAQARWVELVPSGDMASWSRADLREAMEQETLQQRLGLSARLARSRSRRRRSPSGKRRDRGRRRHRRRDRSGSGDEPSPGRSHRRGKGRGKGNRRRSPPQGLPAPRKGAPKAHDGAAK